MFQNVSNPAAFGAEWADSDGGRYQLVNSRGTAGLYFSTCRVRQWHTTPVANPERFGMTRPPESWREFAGIVEQFITATA